MARKGQRCKTRSRVCFSNDTATTEISTLSLHDALPISHTHTDTRTQTHAHAHAHTYSNYFNLRSEEHTSELQSHLNLGCRILLQKNKGLPGPRTVLSPVGDRGRRGLVSVAA